MSDPTPVIDEDLYCLTCSYNLRGLSGDPVRCPECGNLNPLGGAELPPDLIAKQLKRLEGELGGCFVALLAGVPFDVAFCGLLLCAPQRAFNHLGGVICDRSGRTHHERVLAFGLLEIPQVCSHKRGWLRALVMYHVWAGLQLLLILGPATIYVIFGKYIYDVLARWIPEGWAIFTYLVGLPAMIVGSAVWTRGFHRPATAPFAEFHREYATELAYMELHRKLRHKRHRLSHRAKVG